jgi:MASE9
MEGTPRPGQIFIGLIVLGGLSMVTYSALERHPWHHYQFLLLLVIAVLVSRFKLKLPGLNGNMSVNLPFILIAQAQLSPAEALIIACASTLMQCLPRAGAKLKPVQVVFNISTMAIAVGLSGLIFQGRMPLPTARVSGSLLVVLAGATFFLVQTIPVATVIALTEGAQMLRTWSSIVHLSFPYYVLSAGVASIVTTASQHLGWQIPLLVLPAMYGVYRSYRLYFGRPETLARPSVLAKAAATSV